LIVSDSSIIGGFASHGAGILTVGFATISGSTLSANAARVTGEGIYNDGTLTLTNSTVSGNTAGDAHGGLGNVGGAATVINSKFTGNSAPNYGGIAGRCVSGWLRLRDRGL